MSSLRGLRVAVTRAAAQADELVSALLERGAVAVPAPLIRIVPRLDDASVQRALGRVSEFDWLVFTSANGVDLFVEGLRNAGGHADSIRASVACVGPATAAAAHKHGLEPSVIPDEFVGHAIADAIAGRTEVKQLKILLARAQGGREELPERLRAAGADVTDVTLYHSGPDLDGARDLRAHLDAQTIDLLTFTSGSTVRYFREHVGDPGLVKVAVIGPMTAEAARGAGLRIDVEASRHTTEGLVSAIVEYFEENR